jgi:hypothetical protein
VTPITFTLTPADMLAANRLAMQRYVRKGLPKVSLAVVVTALAVTLVAYAFNPQPLGVAGALFARIVALYVGVAAVGVAYVLFVAPGSAQSRTWRKCRPCRARRPWNGTRRRSPSARTPVT